MEMLAQYGKDARSPPHPQIRAQKGVGPGEEEAACQNGSRQAS